MIDAHAHVWDPRVLHYPWLRGPLDRPMLPIEHGDTSCVAVEADPAPGSGVAEARWIAGLDWPGLAGIVAHVEMDPNTWDADLEALTTIPLVCGVRPSLQDAPAEHRDPALLAALIDRATAEGLTVDLCVRSGQLDAVAAAVPRASDTARVVIDHLGKPPVAAGLISAEGERWLAALAALAGHPGTTVKLSGLSAECPDRAVFDRHAPDFLHAAWKLFGSDRSMFGSDRPVSTLLGAAASVADAAAHLEAIVPEPERVAVFDGTARRVYRLAARVKHV